MSGQRTRGLLAQHGLRPNKALGQNFLIDDRVCERIVAAAALTLDDAVVEIGPGLGALTFELAAQARQVLAVDADAGMVRALGGALRAETVGNVELRHQDALGLELGALARELGGPLVVVGNLPYQITSPLLFHLLDQAEAGAVVKRCIVMVQKEFADRMTAAPGSKIYGRLSVMAQQQAHIETLFRVSPGAFLPQPQITSTVLRLAPRPAPRAPVRDAAMFAAVVRAGFSTRRKMVKNALGGAFADPAVDAALAVAGVAPGLRAEVLAIEDFARIADALTGAGVGVPRVGADRGTLQGDDA